MSARIRMLMALATTAVALGAVGAKPPDLPIKTTIDCTQVPAAVTAVAASDGEESTAVVEIIGRLPVEFEPIHTAPVEVESLRMMPTRGEWFEMPWEHRWIEANRPNSGRDPSPLEVRIDELLICCHLALTTGSLIDAMNYAGVALALDPEAVAAHPLVVKTHLLTQLREKLCPPVWPHLGACTRTTTLADDADPRLGTTATIRPKD